MAVTAYAIEFSDIAIAGFLFGVCMTSGSVILGVTLHSKRLLAATVGFIAAIGLWRWTNNSISEVEFVRTPPCWGMHSMDPGSGVGCPQGMREDFTLQELRAYYRNLR